MRNLVILSLGLSAILGCASDAPDAPDADGAADVGPDGAAASLAADRGISVAEAAQRMAWQDKLDDVEAALQSQLPTAYAGVWIDPDRGDRVQIAVTADASAADVMAIAQKLGIDAGTDIVRVERSHAELQSISDDVTARLGDRDSAAVGIDPIANVVTLTVAPGATALGAIADDLARQYGAALAIQSPVGATPAAKSFDPPMRGGVEMQASTSNATISCTTGFFAHSTSGTHPAYIISAGHCVTEAADSGVWSANFANGTAHGLTNGGAFKVNAGGDMSILKMVNLGTWEPEPWIVVQKGPSTSFNARYGITGNSASHVGARVCHTGISSGTSCGTIQKLDVPITYDGGKTIVGHQVQVGVCGKSGDSGGPVFASHKALGTYSATGGSPCVSYYEPIGQIESQMGVSVAHCLAKGATTSSAGRCCSLEVERSQSPDFDVCL